MATLTIKNIPDDLVRRLKAQAERHRRSLNAEIIHVLDSAQRGVPVDVEALIARARSIRAIPDKAPVTPVRLKAWKTAGRS